MERQGWRGGALNWSEVKVVGGSRLAGVLSTVARGDAGRRDQPWD